MIQANFTVVENKSGEPQMFIYTNPNSQDRTPAFYKAVKMTEADIRESNLEYVDVPVSKKEV